MSSDFREHSRKLRQLTDERETWEVNTARKQTTVTFQEFKTRIRRTFSKFAVVRYRKGNELSAEYQL